MPGQEPHFQPDFPAEFVEQTRQVVRCRTTQRRFWQRARIVVLLDEDHSAVMPKPGVAMGLTESSWSPGSGRRRTAMASGSQRKSPCTIC